MVTTTGGIQATAIDSHITQFNGASFDVNDFNIFYVDGGNLFFGNDTGSKDASTPALRPDTLDFDRIFIRQ